MGKTVGHFAKILLVTPLVLMLVVTAARAVAPTGACCVAPSQCEDLIEFQCENVDGDFIGTGTSCADIDCTPVAAPLLSMFGLVATIGMLITFGAYRIMKKRSERPSAA